MMIEITPTLRISDSELSVTFLRSLGPGGQNVNKVETAVQLRFDAARSPALSAAIVRRLATLAGRRMTKDGIVVITANRFRARERNREDALARLIELIRTAAQPVKRRRATRPTLASKERRRAGKEHRSERKRQRGKPPSMD